MFLNQAFPSNLYYFIYNSGRNSFYSGIEKNKIEYLNRTHVNLITLELFD